MRSRDASVRSARRHGDAVAGSRGVEWLARSGLVARGVIYAIIGLLAVKLALGDGGRATNQQGALKTIAHQPFGKALLVVVAVGLAGYALWRIVRAVAGHGPEASDDGLDRVAGLASGAAYALLCATAITILIGAGSGAGGSGNTKKTTAGVLGWTGGTWIVALAGLILIGVAAYQGHKGVTRGFLEDSKTEQMSPRGRRLFTAIGVFGHLARMVVFGLVGYFLIRAAIAYDPHKAVGLDGALGKLAHNSYGPFLLGVVAAGLVGFALYSVADARYRRV